MKATSNPFYDLLIAVDPNLKVHPTDTFNTDRIMMTLVDLGDRPRMILTRRFGLDGSKPQTRAQIAREYQVTQERIRQIEVNALSHLRRTSRKRLLLDPTPISHILSMPLKLEWNKCRGRMTWEKMSVWLEWAAELGWRLPTAPEVKAAIRSWLPGFTSMGGIGVWTSTISRDENEAVIVKRFFEIESVPKTSKQLVYFARTVTADGQLVD